MFPCPSCRSHLRPPTGEHPRCVFCGVLVDARAVALLVALTVPACSEEHYGVMVTDVEEQTDGPADTGDTGDE